jgi:hypothetical protein
MTETFSGISRDPDSEKAGRELGRNIRDRFRGEAADAVILFASAKHDHAKLLAAISAESGTDVVVGSSSAGEFTDAARGEGFISVLALRSPTMQFATGIGRRVSEDARSAADDVVKTFRARDKQPMPYRSALVLTDALAGHTDAVVEQLTVATGGNYRFFGGGAGDDGRFEKTHVFCGTEAVSDAVVALEILSTKPIGVGVSHGWLPAGPGMRVTEVDGMRLIGLNGAPAVQAFEEHARATDQVMDPKAPLPFFLHNIIGIASKDGFRLRVPLGVNADGSISCAAAVPLGGVVHIMKTSAESAVIAAEQATRAALEGLQGRAPKAAIVFDCVATRLRLGRAFDDELKACADLLKPASFVGCNTYGQIARAEGQFGGFHNCTAVVCAISE